MTPFLGLLLILVIVFLGARMFGRSAIVKNPLFSGLVVSGIPYVLIGVILGPRFFNFLNPNIITSLQPLISLALGWIGLLFGLQLRVRNIRRFPGNYLLFTSVQSLISFLFIFSVMIVSFLLFAPIRFENKLEAAIILAALGSITAPLSIARVVIEKKARGRLTHLLQFVSSLDCFWGITIAGLATAVLHPPATQWISAFWQWILITLGISVAVALAFRALLQLRFQQEEIMLFVLGLVIFTSGIGFYLHLSPIFLTMIVGMTLAQFPRESEKVMRVIHWGEKPIYLFMLVFAGALWNYQFWGEVFLILLFLLARLFGKYIGGWIGSKKIDCAFPIPPNVGNSLLSFGGVSLAIAFNFQLFHGGLMGDFIMSATIVGILIFDEYTAVSLVRMLRRQGEIA
ncbi:MAG: hypothetical protein Kow0042_05980 [Calditrichia bacterium]